MNLLFRMAMKDIKLLLRDKAGMFWLIAFPVLNAVIWGLVQSGGSEGAAKMNLIAVDEDGSKFSKAVIVELAKGDSVSLQEMPLDAARDRVRTGKAVAAIVLKKGIGDSNGLGLFGSAEGEEKIELLLDPAQKIAGSVLQGLMMQSLFTALQDSIMDPGAMRNFAKQGLDSLRSSNSGLDAEQKKLLENFLESTDKYLGSVDKDVYREGLGGGATADAATSSTTAAATTAKPSGAGQLIRMKQTVLQAPTLTNVPRAAFDITFPGGMMWAVIASCAAFAVSLVTERERGTMRRLLVAPVNQTQIIGGKALACMMTCFAMILFMLCFGVLVFHVSLRSVPMFIVAAFFTSVAFVGVMMLLTTMGKTERAVSGSCWGILLVMMMFGGGMVPLFAMRGWMVTASNFSPAKWAIYSLEAGIWRDLSWSELVVPYLILTAIGTIGFIAGAKNFARTTR